MKINEYHGLNFRVVKSVCLGVGIVDVWGCDFMCVLLLCVWIHCKRNLK